MGIRLRWISEPTDSGYTARFNLIATTGTGVDPISLARQRFTLTLDEHYTLTPAQMDFFRKSYGVEVSESSPPWQLTRLTDFMAHTGLNAEQVEMLLCRQTRAVRLSPNCPSENLQHAGVTLPQSATKELPFPHPNQYGACYVNGTGTGANLNGSELEPDAESVIRDQFDNAMGLEQITIGDSKQWHLIKASLDRLDRLQRMIRLQRWLQIPFAKLDTLIMSAIRAEGEDNLTMELNENTLRALGVFRYLDRRYGIDPEEFAALMHDLTPYASGKDEVPLFDQVFNRVQLFDSPLILDQGTIDLNVLDPVTQKTVLQLCAGLGVQPTEDSFLLIAVQTRQYLTTLKRDLPTISSLYRQARIARLFGHSVADLLTLAGLLGGSAYKTVLASGRLRAQTTAEKADILDVLMQLDWAFEWIKDSQQTVLLLQQRLGPHASLRAGTLDSNQQPQVAEPPPLPDNLLERLNKLQEDTRRSMVTEAQVAALGLPLTDNASSSQPIRWFELLVNRDLAVTPGATLTLIVGGGGVVGNSGVFGGGGAGRNGGGGGGRSAIRLSVNNAIISDELVTAAGGGGARLAFLWRGRRRCAERGSERHRRWPRGRPIVRSLSRVAETGKSQPWHETRILEFNLKSAYLGIVVEAIVCACRHEPSMCFWDARPLCRVSFYPLTAIPSSPMPWAK